MGMHARVVRVELDDFDRAIAFVRERIVPSAGQQPGLVAAFWLGDRAGSRGLALTVWESEDAMLASEPAAREASRTEAKDGAVVAATVERYEVLAHL
jgi:hypothetical protein